MNEQILLKSHILNNLSKSGIRDLEFEVAHARLYYSEQIKNIKNSIVHHRIERIKDICLASNSSPAVDISFKMPPNKTSTSYCEMPLFSQENITTEIQVSY